MKKAHAKAVSLWDQTTIEEIVEGLLHCSRGNPDNLKVSHRDLNCIWGRLSERLFQVNQAKHRFWLHIAYSQNRRDIKTKFLERVGIEESKVNPDLELSSTPVHCFCKKQETLQVIKICS